MTCDFELPKDRRCQVDILRNTRTQVSVGSTINLPFFFPTLPGVALLLSQSVETSAGEQNVGVITR